MTLNTPRTIDDLARYPARLGVAFRDVTLFQQALTHRSYLNEHPGEALRDNERLEFLGDAVLAFVAAEMLYERLPDMPEGSLTRLRAGLVRNERLAGYATALGLDKMLLMGKGEEDSGGRARTRNLGSAFEAVVGALYLDQGMEAARAFVRPHFEPDIEAMIREKSDKDAKSRLQEWSQVALGQIPSYRVVTMTGPEHAPEFTVEVLIGGEVYGTGKGRSKQAATQAAARHALQERGLEG